MGMRICKHGRMKRALAVFLGACTLLTGTGIGNLVEAEGTASGTRGATKYRLGDIDKNGKVELSDSLTSLKAALSIIRLEVMDERIADVNKDGVLDLSDTVITLKAALAIIELNEYVSTEKLALKVDGVNGRGSIITEEEDIVLRGSVFGTEKPVSLKYIYDGVEGNKEASIVDGMWESDRIALSVGSNTVAFTVEGADGTVVNEEVVIYRTSDQVKASDDIVAFDVENSEQLEDIKAISESLRDYSVLDDGTEQDACELIVDETSPLYHYIQDGAIKPNEIVYIPENEFFPSGLTFRYEKMDDSCESGKEFQPSSQEIIHGWIPSIAELLDGEGCLASDSMDEENPIAFVCGPIGTELEMGRDTINNRYAGALKTEFSYGDDQTVKKKGFQFQNIKRFKLAGEQGWDTDGKYVQSISLKFDKVILFDEDGNESTKEDRIVLDGSVGLKDIRPIFGCEWGEDSKIPRQIISTVEYTENAKVKATFGGTLRDKKNLMEGIKYEDTQLDEEKNAVNLFAGLKASGVDLSESIVIGAIGFRLGGVELGTMRTIQGVSEKMKLNPMVVVTLYVDVNGKLSTTASIAYDYSCYVKKGVNVQRKDYEGGFGTCEENNNGVFNSSVGDYQVNVYDTRAKSKKELDEAPEGKVSFSADGKAEALAGIGVGAGLMIYGIIPAYVKAGIQLDAEAAVHGSVQFHYPYKDDYGKDNAPSFLDSVDVDGDIKIGANIHTMAKAFVRLMAFKKEGIIQFETGLNKTFDIPEIKMAEWEFSSAKIEGIVHEKDTLKAIEGATVTLTAKNVDSFGRKMVHTAVTDKDGGFELKNCSEGDYVFTVEKDGFQDYKKENYSIQIKTDQSREKEEITMVKEEEEWRGAYLEFMLDYANNSSHSKQRFTLAYIDEDNVPELVIWDGEKYVNGGVYCSVYTLYDKKVSRCGNFDEWGIIKYVKKENLIHSWDFSTGEENMQLYLCLSTGSVEVLHCFYNEEGIEFKYNGIAVSEKEYNKKLQEVEGGKVWSEILSSDCLLVNKENVASYISTFGK